MCLKVEQFALKTKSNKLFLSSALTNAKIYKKTAFCEFINVSFDWQKYYFAFFIARRRKFVEEEKFFFFTVYRFLFYVFVVAVTRVLVKHLKT